MQSVCIFVLAAVAGSALAEPALKEALAINDECQSEDQSAVCAVKALQVRAIKKQTANASCMPESQWCGNSYAEQTCCGNNHCVRVGSIFKCMPQMAPSPRPPAHCMPDDQWCGNAYPEKDCCGGNSKCIRDGNIFKCKPQTSCKTIGSVCGGPYTKQSQCCGGAVCKKMYGSSSMKCVENHGDTCANTNSVCGGPGRRTLRCCNSRATCEKSYGPYGSDGTMKCTDSQQCVRTKGVCGGPGRQNLQCCTGECKPKSWLSPNGEKTCQGNQQCARTMAVCGGPGRQTLPCCEGGKKCRGAWGANDKKCQ